MQSLMETRRSDRQMKSSGYAWRKHLPPGQQDTTVRKGWSSRQVVEHSCVKGLAWARPQAQPSGVLENKEGPY